MQQTKDMPDVVEPEEVYWDVILDPGDVLYVPRGWWHNPLPLDGETFHLAIGTFAPTGFDYLNWLVQLAPTILDGRRNLHDYEGSQELLERFGRELGKLMSSRSVFENFMAGYIGQHRMDSKFSLSILGNNKVSRLEEAQQVRLNVNQLYQFSDGVVIVNGNRLNVDKIGRNLITHLYKNHLCSVGEIIAEFSDYPASKLHELLFQLALNDVIELTRKEGMSFPKIKVEASKRMPVG